LRELALSPQSSCFRQQDARAKVELDPTTRSKTRSKTRPSLIDALLIDLLNAVLSSIDDARAFLCVAASCKAILALERETHDEQGVASRSWPGLFDWSLLLTARHLVRWDLYE
jgi:hypothetical protein